MPLDDAMALISRNFEAYVKELREKALTVAAAPPVPAPSPAAAVTAAAAAKTPEFVVPDKQTHYLLNLLADNRILTLEELDTVIKYLEERRRKLLEAKGIRPGKRCTF